MIGITNETLIRLLSELKNKHLITISGKTISILDKQKLRLEKNKHLSCLKSHFRSITFLKNDQNCSVVYSFWSSHFFPVFNFWIVLIYFSQNKILSQLITYFRSSDILSQHKILRFYSNNKPKYCFIIFWHNACFFKWCPSINSDKILKNDKMRDHTSWIKKEPQWILTMYCRVFWPKP